MKANKMLVAAMMAGAVAFTACENKGGEADKAKADSLAQAQKADSLKKEEEKKKAEEANKPKSVADIAMADTTNFGTLVTAVKAADLVGALSNASDSITVFAPTNAAFAAVDKKALADLLKPENKAKLADVLKFHVVKGTIKSSDIKDGVTEVTTLQGKKLKVEKKDGKVTVNGANVTTADVATGSGVVHVIDKVVMP
ncbi:MAG: fasciclin domain-containing protein [Raineya sp.]|jgi:uncharacterized surface protein with fasciclin (FAS1) repeats|nr:fasciclin domain-containing protein [Raineya sp.]